MADKDSRKGKAYIDETIVGYVNKLHASHDAGLQQAFLAPEKHSIPAIQVAPQEGALLELLVRLSGAKRIVEVGTLAGYSTLRLARSMPAEGRVWSIEFDEKHAAIARDNIAAAGLEDFVEVRVGAGVEVLPSLEEHGPFDIVFIDADKVSYPEYGRWARNHLRKGGLLIGDNAFLFGNLLSESETAHNMRTFHEEAAEHFDTLCVPTPDGVLIGIRR